MMFFKGLDDDLPCDRTCRCKFPADVRSHNGLSNHGRKPDSYSSDKKMMMRRCLTTFHFTHHSSLCVGINVY
jgi:hypothetical protein